MKIYDISPSISEQIAVFPGDTPFKQKIALNFDQGHHMMLSSIESTVHLGAHTDAPNHYDQNGCDISQRNLEFYLGSCQVIKVTLEPGKRIYPQDLTEDIKAPRVLFYTNSFPNPNQWNDDFNSLSPELVEYLQQKKVILVGIDTPSVDPAHDDQMLSHKSIAKRDMAILEGIVLNHVPEGLYELIALPLKIMGADASPVRAILRQG